MFRVQGPGFSVLGSVFQLPASGFRVSSFGFSVSGVEDLWSDRRDAAAMGELCGVVCQRERERGERETTGYEPLEHLRERSGV